MRTVRRWEVGSTFALTLPNGMGPRTPPGVARANLPDPLRLYGSGRQALIALLRFGRAEHGWTAVHLPTYYCPEVVDSIGQLLPVRRYDGGPTGPIRLPAAGPSDAVVAVSYFGAPPALPESAAAVLVDATHDPLAPWPGTARADYVFASLRKTLPLPDGGALWSTTGRPLPPAVPPSDAHLACVEKILSAMCLKAAYLAGASLDKDGFRALFVAGEDGLRTGEVSGISEYSAQVFPALPARDLRRSRIRNSVRLAAALRGTLTVHAHPFGAVLECDSYGQREAVRRGLIARNVYPAVLWSLCPGEVSGRQLDFSRRMLFLPTDFRYDERDMRRVAALVRDVRDACARAVPVKQPAARTRRQAATSVSIDINEAKERTC